jgi:hypothetical protein
MGLCGHWPVGGVAPRALTRPEVKMTRVLLHGGPPGELPSQRDMSYHGRCEVGTPVRGAPGLAEQQMTPVVINRSCRGLLVAVR